MLKIAGMNLPTKVRVHGFLTVNGQKMSKSRGTFLLARAYLEHLNPAALRYFYATKLSGGIDDIDLNLEEFTTKVNTDLIGKLVNLASRTARWLKKTGLSSTYPDDGGLFAKAAADGEAIAAAYESCDFARAMRIIMQAADRANQYVDNEQPWKLAKQGPQEQQKLQDVASVSLNLFRQLVVYLTPVLPKLVDSVAKLVGPPITDWQQSQTPLENLPVDAFQPLMKRIEPQQIDALLAASNTLPSTPQGSTVSETSNVKPEPGALAQDSTKPLESEALAETCTIDDFSKVDLRVARVVDAEEVP